MGALEIQVFVSLVVILGAAFVALICDFLKGSNEQLREANIVMRVREDERDKRDDLVEKVQQQTIEVVAKVQGALAGRPAAAPQAAARVQQPPVAAPPPAPVPAPLATPVADARELFERAQQERSMRGRRGNRRAESKPPVAPPSESVASWAQDIVIRKHQEAEPTKAPVAEPVPAAAVPAAVAPPLPVPIPAAAARVQQQEFAAQESPAPPAAVPQSGPRVPMAEAAALPLAPVATAGAPAVPAYSNLSAGSDEDVAARSAMARQEATPAMVQDQQPLATRPVPPVAGFVTPGVDAAPVELESAMPRAARTAAAYQLAEAGSVAGVPGQPAAAAVAPAAIEAAALPVEAESSLPVSALCSEVPVFDIVPPVLETAEEPTPVADVVEPAVVEAVEPMVVDAPAEEFVEAVAALPTPDYSLLEDTPVYAEIPTLLREAEPVADAEPVAEIEPVADAEPLFAPTLVEGAPEEEGQVVRIRVISDDDLVQPSEFVDTPITLDEMPMAAQAEPAPVAEEAAPEPEPVIAAEAEAEPVPSWTEVIAAMAAEAEPVAETVAPVEPVAAADALPEPVAAAEVPVADVVAEPSIWLPGAEPATWDLQPAPAEEAPEPVLAEASSFDQPAADDPFSFRPAAPEPVAETPAPEMPRSELRSKVVEMRAAAQARQEAELPAVPTLELPGGFHEPNALARLLEDETPFAGLVIAVSVVDYVRLMADQGKPAIEQIMGSVTRLVMSLTREQDFACRIAEDEFVLIFARETGAAAKRRIQLVSERLWDYQLRSLGSVSIIFSWGAAESQMQPIVHAVENAREQMLETRRNRRNLTGVSRRFGRHAANS